VTAIARSALLLSAAAVALTATLPAQSRSISTPADELRARRDSVGKQIGRDGVLIAFSAEPARRTGDVDWPFRQEDNLLYLTGFAEPETTLVLLPGEADTNELIYVREPDPLNERWTGRIPLAAEVTAATGVRDVRASRRFAGFVDGLLRGAAFGSTSVANYFRPPTFPAFLKSFQAGRAQIWLLLQERGSIAAPTREQRFADDLRRRYPEIQIRDATPLLVAMREVKSASEIALIQRAVDITVAAQKAAMARVLTATKESEVQATVEYTFRNLGACCWAFPSIIAGGHNATTLHYISNDAPLARDSLLLSDIGAEVEGYSADVTRTFPASGVFSSEQRAIYQIVLSAQDESLPLMRPGSRFGEVQQKAQQVVGRELLKLGLITANVPEQVQLYMFHGVGHMLGLQTHDVYNPARAFEAGMVLTNEPGVYVRKADILASPVFQGLAPASQASVRAAIERYDGIGVRIEDDVHITSGGPVMMSGEAPRSIRDIEALMAAAKTGPSDRRR
jgi:Xaa-Pro aminopeptidase